MNTQLDNLIKDTLQYLDDVKNKPVLKSLDKAERCLLPSTHQCVTTYYTDTLGYLRFLGSDKTKYYVIVTDKYQSFIHPKDFSSLKLKRPLLNKMKSTH